MRHLKLSVFAVAASIAAAGAAHAQVAVGIITSLSGPVSSIGIPYDKGYKAWEAGGTEVAGQKLKLIEIDDASDPSAAARAAKKLIEEDHVDVILGAASTPASMAVYGVSSEAKVPLIITANGLVPGEKGAWEITIPQPPELMVAADIPMMQKAGVKTVAYIGYSDAWGDLVYNALLQSVKGTDIKLIANERYARTDTSVTPQVLKIIAMHPDAVLTGGSGSVGALPHLALAERGYRGHVYSTHAIINSEFVRVGGASVEGLIAPTGPVVVAEQLPDSNPIKAVAMRFRELYQKANNAPSTDAFAAYTYDAMLVLSDAIKRVGKSAKPGTAEYRSKLHDAIVTTHEVVGTHAIYTFTPTERFGVDERSRVMVRLDHGTWKLVQ
jgi:branched-chain amino acid transport system substrate-binding protein